VFEIGLVERAGREQDDARTLAFSQCRERVALRTEERSEAQDVGATEKIGQNIGNDGAILQRIAAARWSLRAIGKHPPLAVRRAGEVDRQHVKITVRGDTHAHQRAEKCGVGIEQRGGEVAVGNEALRAVKIFEKRLSNWARWMIPASMKRHSSAEISKGTTSIFHGRFAPSGSL
jgi:hypothetical protein